MPFNCFSIKSVRDGVVKIIDFSQGDVVADHPELPTDEPNGTFVAFTPDEDIFRTYHYIDEYVVAMLKNLYLPECRAGHQLQW